MDHLPYSTELHLAALEVTYLKMKKEIGSGKETSSMA
jgi:hypothetical protein